MLDRSLDVLELVQHRLAERLGPVELRVHAGENIGIVEQADDARVPVRIRLQLGLLGQLAEEPVGRDDLDRERRALQDQDQQRIRIERDRGDQNVELLRSEGRAAAKLKRISADVSLSSLDDSTDLSGCDDDCRALPCGRLRELSRDERARG